MIKLVKKIRRLCMITWVSLNRINNSSDPHSPPLTDLCCRKVCEVPFKWCKEHTHWPNVHLLHLEGGEHSWQALTHLNDPHDPQWRKEGSTHGKHSHIPVIHMILKRERVIKKVQTWRDIEGTSHQCLNPLQKGRGTDSMSPQWEARRMVVV